MFFRSWKSLLLAKISIVVGCFLLFFGLVYRDTAKRERSTVGQITSVKCNKGCTFGYVFTANGVSVSDYSDICKTSLTQQHCIEGALVRVYYDPEHLSESRLQEYGAASREKLIFGTCLVVFGLILIALFFLIKRAEGSNGDSLDPERNLDGLQPDEIHVVPGESSR